LKIKGSKGQMQKIRNSLLLTSVKGRCVMSPNRCKMSAAQLQGDCGIRNQREVRDPNVIGAEGGRTKELEICMTDERRDSGRSRSGKGEGRKEKD